MPGEEENSWDRKRVEESENSLPDTNTKKPKCACVHACAWCVLCIVAPEWSQVTVKGTFLYTGYLFSKEFQIPVNSEPMWESALAKKSLIRSLAM